MDGAADAVHANYLGALELVAESAPDAVRQRFGDLVLVDTGIDEAGLNVVSLIPNAEPVDLYLEMAERWFGERGRAFRLVAREGIDDDLLTLARRRGYVEWFREPALARAVEGVAETPVLEIRAVETTNDTRSYARVEPGTPEDIALAEEIAVRVAATPGVTLLLGFVGGEAVARGMAFASGETVGVYNVYVRPAHRRRRIGESITMAAVAAGRGAGARLAGLQATPEGLELYRAMGFEPIYDLVSLCRAT